MTIFKTRPAVETSHSLNISPSESVTALPAATALKCSPGKNRFSANARKKAENVLITTILITEEPLFFCTAVSVIILWEQSTITPNIVIALTSKSNETATDIAV